MNLSFALNYAAGGLDPWGYHVTNVFIHVMVALVLFGLVRRTLAGTMEPAHKKISVWEFNDGRRMIVPSLLRKDQLALVQRSGGSGDKAKYQ